MNENGDLARSGLDGDATAWHPADFGTPPRLALIGEQQARPILPEIDLWDCWPLQHEDGRTAAPGGAQYWFFLSAPRFPDPGHRHLVARIRLLRHRGGTWHDCGPALPEGLGLGHAEWAGSAVLHDDGETISLFYTASGSPAGPGFQQKLVVAKGRLGAEGPCDWSASTQIVAADGTRYQRVDAADGQPGMIKAFRDPAWFRDPATGKAHILFTGSAAWSDDAFNGLIGMATLNHDQWQLERPLVTAVGANNELERPHIVMRDSRYYLFWSTQRAVFSPAAEQGPNGLYAMVAERLDGPWRPINGNALVVANPAEEQVQSYSWWVTGEGIVWSFIDHWGMAGRNFADHPALLRDNFGGTPAPCFALEFDGDRISIKP